MSTIQAPVGVLNSHVPLVQAPEPEWPEVDVPDPVRDLLQADILSDADRGHVDPSTIPPNAAVPAHIPRLEPIGILEGWQPVRHRPVRGHVILSGCRLIQRLVRPLIVELLPKHIEAPLLRGQTAG